MKRDKNYWVLLDDDFNTLEDLAAGGDAIAAETLRALIELRKNDGNESAIKKILDTKPLAVKTSMRRVLEGMAKARSKRINQSQKDDNQSQKDDNQSIQEQEHEEEEEDVCVYAGGQNDTHTRTHSSSSRIKREETSQIPDKETVKAIAQKKLHIPKIYTDWWYENLKSVGWQTSKGIRITGTNWRAILRSFWNNRNENECDMVNTYARNNGLIQ